MKKLAALFILLASACHGFSQVNFQKVENLDDLFKNAAATKKPIFLDAYTDWCGWCKVQDKKIFAGGYVADSINKYFYPVKLEMEKDMTGVRIARKFGVSVFPSTLIIAPDGHLVKLIEGYSEPEKYLEKLMKVAAMAKRGEKAKGFSNEYYLEYPRFYKDVYPLPGKEGERADSATVNEYISVNAIEDERTWVVINRFIGLINEQNIERLTNSRQSIEKTYGEAAFKNLAEYLTQVQLQRCIKRQDELCLNNLLETFKKNGSLTPWISFFAETEFYLTTGNFARVVNAAQVYFNLDENNAQPFNVNSIAWELYLNCDDTALLLTSVKWMEDYVIQQAPEFAYLDTYAALLYKTGNYAKAREQALLAIEAGKAAEEDTGETEELLLKIEGKLKRE